MNNFSFYTRQMLATYGRQLVSARRMARYEQIVGRVPTSEDAVALRRRAVVERVAREVVDNLIFSGSDNPIVTEVRKELELAVGHKLEFQYPPASLEYRVFKVDDTGEKVELPKEEKRKILDKLWDVTLHTVDATML